MLGYVQSGTVAEWETKLGSHFAKNATGLQADATGFVAQQILNASYGRYHSVHQRPTVGRKIHIYHILLLFH